MPDHSAERARMVETYISRRSERDPGVLAALREVPRERFADLALWRREALRRPLCEPRPELFIGVVYRPETELQSHQVPVTLLERFDAWVWFEKLDALAGLGPEQHRGMPQSCIFGE